MYLVFRNWTGKQLRRLSLILQAYIIEVLKTVRNLGLRRAWQMDTQTKIIQNGVIKHAFQYQWSVQFNSQRRLKLSQYVLKLILKSPQICPILGQYYDPIRRNPNIPDT